MSALRRIRLRRVARRGIIRTMNCDLQITSCVAALLCCAASAAVVPQPEFADGEAHTVLHIPARGAADRTLRIRLSLDAAAANNAEVALGEGVSFGWDCGEWFLEGDLWRDRRVAAGPSPVIEISKALGQL